MIHKITQIKSLGKFKSTTFGKENWNGILQKNSIFFANNGSGKTTLSLMFRSLKNNNEILLKKKTFNSSEPIQINLFDDNRKEIKFAKNKWNRNIEKIEIYDSYYIEDNVYVISIKDNNNGSSIFEILLGEESIELRKEIDIQKSELNKLQNKRINIRNKKNKSTDSKIIEESVALMLKNSIEKEKVRTLIKRAEEQIIALSEKHKDKYLTHINHYLQVFNPNLKLNQLTQINSKAIYNLEISGYSFKNDKEYSLKYSLSEGDKNALSLSFFFAKLELLDNLSEYIVVIDDPIASFDYARKTSTINIIKTISKKVKQLILMTHDLKFAFDLSKKLNFECENIKIEFNGNSSYFTNHDIEKESLTGVFKDLSVLNDYLTYGCSNDTERREIIRCIRPSIEGLFRIKFFGELKSNEWLGDIIDRIRNSEEDSSYYIYKNHLNELTEINDYSKEFHHSNPYYFETSINDYELRNFVTRTINLIRNI